MAALELPDVPWTRKHDDPRQVLVPHADVAYPTSLSELVELCASGRSVHAAGSHWGLSTGALSDTLFVETHDPANRQQAMGRTLTDVVPAAMTDAYLRHMADQHGDDRWSVVHIEAGKRIYQLYAELDQVGDVDDEDTLAGLLNHGYGNDGFAGPWGFATLGGAGGQTVVGAFSTGTHGGDFDRPPVADSVLAIHLVADGGRHYWIEPDDPDVPPLTDAAALRDRYGDVGEFDVVRDTSVFDAVLVSVGRFGVVYSVVLRAVPQYELHEERRLAVWQDLRADIARLDSPLWRGYPGTDIGETAQRFLQVAVSLTPHGTGRNRVGVTKRWTVPLTAAAPGRAERVGGVAVAHDPLLGAPRFTRAGRWHAYSPDPANPHRGADPGMLERACADGNFLVGILRTANDELRDFATSDGAVIGTAVAAVAGVGPGGLALLYAALRVIVELLADLLDALSDEVRFGEVMDRVRRLLLDPDRPPEHRAAGLFAWRLLVYVAFGDQQADRDYRAVGYAVMDQHDYLNLSCEVNVRSIEVFFEATDSRLTAFVDALAAFEAEQEQRGLAFVGYASLRFTQPSRALLGMQRFRTSCAVEIACLADVAGGPELIDYAASFASHPMINGILHWGQHNPCTAAQTARVFGPRLDRWRHAFARLGSSRAFSNAFTRQTGLEP